MSFWLPSSILVLLHQSSSTLRRPLVVSGLTLSSRSNMRERKKRTKNTLKSGPNCSLSRHLELYRDCVSWCSFNGGSLNRASQWKSLTVDSGWPTSTWTLLPQVKKHGSRIRMAKHMKHFRGSSFSKSL